MIMYIGLSLNLIVRKTALRKRSKDIQLNDIVCPKAGTDAKIIPITAGRIPLNIAFISFDPFKNSKKREQSIINIAGGIKKERVDMQAPYIPHTL